MSPIVQWDKPMWKPEKGSHWKAGRDRRKAVDAYEDAEKRKVRLRDKLAPGGPYERD